MFDILIKRSFQLKAKLLLIDKQMADVLDILEFDREVNSSNDVINDNCLSLNTMNAYPFNWMVWLWGSEKLVLFK